VYRRLFNVSACRLVCLRKEMITHYRNHSFELYENILAESVVPMYPIDFLRFDMRLVLGADKAYAINSYYDDRWPLIM
jgi:hypothetical protein